MRTVVTHHAWPLPPRAIKAAVPLMVIIVVAVIGASAMGHGKIALTAVVPALLAAVAEELVRSAMRYRMRVV